jgi:cyclic pyranopterin phosphate synthase
MQMGHLSDRQQYEKKLLPIREVYDLIKQKYNYQPAQTSPDSTSQRFKIKGMGYFGVIANDSAPFCKDCNRLRLTSLGDIHGCLSSNEKFSLLPLLQLSDDAAKKELLRLIGNALATKRIHSFDGSNTLMKQVGG